jgi:hypothetical protein
MRTLQEVKSTMLFAGIFEQAEQDRQAVEKWLYHLTPHQIRELRQITERAKPDSHGYGIVETLRPALIQILKDRSIEFDRTGFTWLTRDLAENLPHWAQEGLCPHTLVVRGSCTECHRYVGTKAEA